MVLLVLFAATTAPATESTFGSIDGHGAEYSVWQVEKVKKWKIRRNVSSLHTKVIL